MLRHVSNRAFVTHFLRFPKRNPYRTAGLYTNRLENTHRFECRGDSRCVIRRSGGGMP